MNQCTLIGNLGQEPDTQTFESGNVRTSLRLATTERGYVTRYGQQVPDRTTWHNVILWGGLARLAADSLHKGDAICVCGKYESRDYEDKAGASHTIYELNVHEMYFLSPRNTTVEDNGKQQSNNA